MVSRTAAVNGVRLLYLQGPGNGPPLLLQHGFPGTPDALRELFAPLAELHHLYAPGVRGMPGSSHVPPYHLRSWMGDLVAFLEQVVGRPAVAIGHSAGAMLLALVAAGRPELITRLVILDMPLSPAFHTEFGNRTAATFRAYRHALAGGGGVEQMAERLGASPSGRGGVIADHTPREELLERARGLLGFDPEVFAPWAEGRHGDIFAIPELAELPGRWRGPTLFLDGDPEAGSLCGPDEVAYNLARFPWAERVQLGGMGHGLGLHGAGGVAAMTAALQAFLAD